MAQVELIDPNIKMPMRKSKTLIGSVNSVGAFVGASVGASVGSIKNKILKNTASKASLKNIFSKKKTENEEDQQEAPSQPAMFRSYSSDLEHLCKFHKNETKKKKK